MAADAAVDPPLTPLPDAETSLTLELTQLESELLPMVTASVYIVAPVLSFTATVMDVPAAMSTFHVSDVDEVVSNVLSGDALT